MNIKTNKIIAIVLSIALFMTFFVKLPVAYGTENKEYILGDADGDGYVKMTDVVSMQKYIAKLVDFSELQKKAADVTFDKQVTMVDVVTVQRYIAHLIKDFGGNVIIIDDSDTSDSDTQTSESDTSSDVFTDSEASTDTAISSDTHSDSEAFTDTESSDDTSDSATDSISDTETDTSSSDSTDSNKVLIDGHTFSYGDKFTLNFYIENIDVSVAAGALSVIFDSSCLAVCSTELLPDISEEFSVTTETNITKDAVYLAFSSPLAGLDMKESTKIFSVTFSVVTQKDTETSIDINTLELFDLNFSDIISDNNIISGSPILKHDITNA